MTILKTEELKNHIKHAHNNATHQQQSNGKIPEGTKNDSIGASSSSHSEIIEALHSKAILQDYTEFDFPELSAKDGQTFTVERKMDKLCGIRARFIKPAFFMGAWFFCSFVTIVLNKYILTTLDADPGILGEFQILMTTLFGFIAMNLPCNFLAKTKVKSHEPYDRIKFFKSMLILGCLRFGSVVCSVVALKYVAVSFSETIKSSAPLFTVIIAYIILGEYSGVYVNMSLVPIMFGLAICTRNELSFALKGFLAAVSNNILDCIQNVYTKKLLIGDQNYSPMDLQFYASVAATVVQLPFWIVFMDIKQQIMSIDEYLMSMLLFNSVVFYFQSFTAYFLMSLISPITFSVASTAKRAFLIWFSILFFGNNVTLLSAMGTVFVVIGVFLYQRARHKESDERIQLLSQKELDKLPV